ncbi:DJ-1 family glyoxalase III [Clostridium aminobutyricum]|uniref:DJ-1/PfpI family protein n=1 Tax=Clostridium aminobutyricum TaxID=33953 RepID=A0A939DAF0_CLOAM|nr:DJ-1 family glyoxalase III [Clostridium aminobutyricum]MBN7773708.1 DJ-1/PfpI family protein [Clostridium aminobutyricum]
MVYVHFAQGFEEVEALTCIDVMRRAGIEAVMVSMTGEKIVKSVRNIGIQTDILFEEADYESCEMIVLPGGMPGAKNLGEHEGLVQHIKDFSANGKWIAAICAAPMVFGHNGLLTGKKATIYPGMEEHLIGAAYSTDRVAVDGNVITSKGPGTAMEFAVTIVELLKGKALAEKLKNDLVMI